GSDLPCRGLSLGKIVGDIRFVEEYLALKIMRLDEIAVDDADHADAGARKVIGEYGSERSAATECHAAGQKRALPLFSELRKPDLRAVSIELAVVGRRGFDIRGVLRRIHSSCPLRGDGYRIPFRELLAGQPQPTAFSPPPRPG